MYLFSPESVEFFREIFSESDVPKRFSGTVLRHSSMIVYGETQKIVFVQKLLAGLFEVFEHQVVCEATKIEVWPTPEKPSLHLHISLRNNDVDAFVSGSGSVELKKEEVNLFYLEEANAATIPQGEHCFFHISFGIDTLLLMLENPAFKRLLYKITQKVRQTEESKGGMINDPHQVMLDAYFMMLIQDIRHCRFNETASLYYREKKCMLMLEHFLRQMQPQKGRNIKLTSEDIITLDHVKEHIKLNINKSLTPETLCKQFNISSSVLVKGFRQMNGITVNHFIRIRRMERAAILLADKTIEFDSIPQSTGYGSFRSFAAAFRKYFNCDPVLFRYL